MYIIVYPVTVIRCHHCSMLPSCCFIMLHISPSTTCQRHLARATARARSARSWEIPYQRSFKGAKHRTKWVFSSKPCLIPRGYRSEILRFPTPQSGECLFVGIEHVCFWGVFFGWFEAPNLALHGIHERWQMRRSPRWFRQPGSIHHDQLLLEWSPHRGETFVLAAFNRRKHTDLDPPKGTPSFGIVWKATSNDWEGLKGPSNS
jgi:hypothetical protein